MNMKKIIFRPFFLVFLLAFLSGCATINAARFDNISYERLVKLYVDIESFYDNLPNVSETDKHFLEREIQKVYYFERYKPYNENMTKQMELLHQMYKEHINNKVTNEFVIRAMKKNILRLMETIILTERSKN